MKRSANQVFLVFVLAFVCRKITIKSNKKNFNYSLELKLLNSYLISNNAKYGKMLKVDKEK